VSHGTLIEKYHFKCFRSVNLDSRGRKIFVLIGLLQSIFLILNLPLSGWHWSDGNGEVANKNTYERAVLIAMLKHDCVCVYTHTHTHTHNIRTAFIDIP